MATWTVDEPARRTVATSWEFGKRGIDLEVPAHPPVEVVFSLRGSNREGVARANPPPLAP